MLYIAKLKPNERASTSNIAREQQIPASFLAKIISQLSISGLLHTSRGAKGGVMLAKDPTEISLLDVVESIDGPIALNECSSDDGNCSLSGDCPIKSVWCDAQDELVYRLKNTNFANFLPA
jgi:Rrf2 family protein